MKYANIMKHTYLILAAILLSCLLPMPYGYFALVRFVTMVAFAVIAYRHWTKRLTSLTVVFGALALLFQPFAKITLGRMMWNIVDVVVALFLVILWLRESKSRQV